MFDRLGAWLRGTRHRRQLRRALQIGSESGPRPLPSESDFARLLEHQFAPWAGRTLPRPETVQHLFAKLDAEQPSIFIFDMRGHQVLARRKSRRLAQSVSDIDARMYAKRVNHYSTLLAAVLARSPARSNLSLAIDLRDIPQDCAEFPLFAFQRRLGAGNLLLPDVDFFHHGWYRSDSDPLSYEQKSVTACFAGASTGQQALTAADIRRGASERLRLASHYLNHPRVVFRIASAVHCVDAEAEAVLRAQPYFTAPMSWAEQLTHRFLISVDGNGATCSRVVKALRSNSVLLKFDSTYELFYFPLLEPGVHFLLAREPQEVDHHLDIEAAQPGHYAGVALAGHAFAERYLTAPSVLAYTKHLLDRYAKLQPGP